MRRHATAGRIGHRFYSDKGKSRKTGDEWSSPSHAWLPLPPISLTQWNESIGWIAWRWRVLAHTHTRWPIELSYASCLKTTNQRKCLEVIFFHHFNSLSSKELWSVCRPFGANGSTALGKCAALCSNRMMIRPLLKTEAKAAANAADGETQRRGIEMKN
jgi:hypothetical protein